MYLYGNDRRREMVQQVGCRPVTTGGASEYLHHRPEWNSRSGHHESSSYHASVLQECFQIRAWSPPCRVMVWNRSLYLASVTISPCLEFLYRNGRLCSGNKCERNCNGSGTAFQNNVFTVGIVNRFGIDNGCRNRWEWWCRINTAYARMR